MASSAFSMDRTIQITTGPTNAQMVAALGRRQIWRSRDGGKKWHRVTQLSPPHLELPSTETPGVEEPVNIDEVFSFADSPSEERIRSFPQIVSREPEEEHPTGTVVRLAVSDEGHLLFWQQSTAALTLCTEAQRCAIITYPKDVAALAFDSQGIAWVATENRLLRFSNQTQVSAMTISGIFQLGYLQQHQKIVAVTRDKLILLNEKSKKPTVEPAMAGISLSNIKGAAVFEDSIFVLQNARVLQHHSNGSLTHYARISPHSQGIKVTREGIWIQQGDHWKAPLGTAATAIAAQPIFDVAVDARQHTWLATAVGPIILNPPPTAPRSLSRCEKSISSDRHLAAAIPAFPNERNRTTHFFPVVKLWTRLTTFQRQSQLDRIIVSKTPWARHQVQLHIGFVLTWNFTPRTAQILSEREKHIRNVNKRKELRRGILQATILSCAHPSASSTNAVEKALAHLKIQKWKTMLSYLGQTSRE